MMAGSGLDGCSTTGLMDGVPVDGKKQFAYMADLLYNLPHSFPRL